MPDKWKWIFFDHPPAFWAAMFSAAAARAAMTGEGFRSAAISVPSSMVFAYVFTRAILHMFDLPADPYLFAVGGLVILMAHPMIRILISITSVSDISNVLAQIIRAWRGK